MSSKEKVKIDLKNFLDLFFERNFNGDKKLINDKDDLILAIATPAAQAVANLTTEIPILVTAVTDPQSANLVKSNEKPDTNVSGTSDLTPVEAQINLIKKLVPDVKKIGFLYCSLL